MLKPYLLIIGLFFAFAACTSQDSPAQTTSNEAADGPVYERVDNARFKSLMAEEDVVLLDVRTPGETARGVIEGAVEIDYRGADFASKIAALDKTKTYLVYCQSGGRSARACTQMQALGFNRLYELETGYGKWQE